MGSVIAEALVAEEQLLASLNDDAEGRLVDGVHRSGRRGISEQGEARGRLDASVSCNMSCDPLGEFVPARLGAMALERLHPNSRVHDGPSISEPLRSTMTC